MLRAILPDVLVYVLKEQLIIRTLLFPFGNSCPGDTGAVIS